MIYLVTLDRELFENGTYKIIGVEESLSLLSSWKMIQFDTETDSLDCHIGKLLMAQFGDIDTDTQIVVDCTTISIAHYKEVLETKFIIGHNLKFDLQWLYNYNIVPRKVYDTMIVEQVLYLGYPQGQVSYSLQSVALKRLEVYIDKTVRGQIIWKGIQADTILYGAKDVLYLYKIMQSQLLDCKNQDCLVAAKLECDAVPVIAYLEWCGIKLDENKWKAKMISDQKGLEEGKKALDDFVTTNPLLSKFTYINREGDLWSGYDLTPKCTINWSSSRQVVEVAKILGFNTTVQDKKTKEDKDSVLEKHLKGQKGINDEFLKLYFNYQEKAKLVSSFGQGHINAINPITGRLHTIFKQLGAASGRMSCGSNQSNEALARYKHLKPSEVSYPNIQQLPSDEITRGCFIAEEGNLLADCDYSAMEARLAGDIYHDEAIIDMFNKGLDSHSVYAKIFFKEELKDISVEDIKSKRPDLRSKAKGPEFALTFGGGAFAIMQAINCTEEEANTIIKNYEEGFKGTTEFAKKGSKFVRKNGYVLINKYTGHKMYWWDHKYWLEEEQEFKKEGFWDSYRLCKVNGSNPELIQRVRTHFQAASKWDRMARNAPTQGTGCNIIKKAAIELFNWIIENNYFNKVKICAIVHDEILAEFPKELKGTFPKKLEEIMFNAASVYCKLLPIPAEAEVATCWVH